MRRMIIGVVILICLFVGWLWEKNQVGTICSDMDKKLELIDTTLLQGDWERGKELMDSMKNHWLEKEKILDMLTPHDDTDEINLDMVRLERYIEQNNLFAGNILINELREHFEEIQTKLQVDYTNIF